MAATPPARLAGAGEEYLLAEAFERLRAAREPDGRWLQTGRPAGRVRFEVDVPAGEPSTWLTLHGTRVLDRWDSRPA